jgi:hypothetical protein
MPSMYGEPLTTLAAPPLGGDPYQAAVECTGYVSPHSREERMAHGNVYVLQLSRDALLDRKFAEKNRQDRPEKPCVFVGMISLTPEDRFNNYRRGYEACG